MKRKLVSIQIVSNIEAIENADNIEKATVMGWSVVVKKGGFVIGDQCVFFEIDSILPKGEEWSDFMKSKKYRVKTIRMRKVLSQGLALSLKILPEGSGPFSVGDEVTDLLNVKKYEPPMCGSGKNMGVSVGAFPPRVPKTDEIRMQSALGVLDEIKNVPFYVSIKCDGTSSTFLYDEDEFSACARRSKQKEDDQNFYWKIARKYDLPELLKKHPNMAVQGEICGPKIQKNNLMLSDYDLFVFNIYDVKKGRYLDFQNFIDFCNDLNLKTVPIELVVNDSNQFDHSLEAWIERAKGKYKNSNRHREGLVVRPLKETYSKTLRGRLSFKVLNNDFLLKGE